MDVRDVGVALWRQRPLVAAVLLVTGAAVATGVAVAPKSYTATATISAVTAPGAADTDDPDALRATLAEFASSQAVADAVRDRLDVDRDEEELRRAIQGEWVRESVVVDITVTDRDPDTAADIGNEVVAVLVAGDATPQQVALALDRTLILEAGEAADPPESFSSPDLALAAGLGLLLALALATTSAVLRDRRTHTVDDAAAAEEAAVAPLLGHLTPPRDLTALPGLNPGTAEADVFRHLRVALEDQADAGSPRVVVAGVVAGDVNVWIGANVALALAGTGRRVLLVDGRMGERFGTPVEQAPDTPGLYDVLVGADLHAALSPGPVDLLQVLPPGRYGDAVIPAVIPDLIAGRFAEVMDAAAADFDHVVVLGPALEICDDSRGMAAGSSIVLAVVESSVSASALRAHCDRIRAAGATVLGVVLVGRQRDRTAA